MPPLLEVGQSGMNSLESVATKTEDYIKLNSEKKTRQSQDDLIKFLKDIHAMLSKNVIPALRHVFNSDYENSLPTAIATKKSLQQENIALTATNEQLKGFTDVSKNVETMIEKWKRESEEPLKNNVKLVVKEHLKEIVKETVECVASTEKFRKSFSDAVKGTQDGIKKEAEKCFTKTLKASLKESQNEVVAQTVARQEADLYEKEKRARNIVIAGIPESTLPEISDRIEADKMFISTIANLPIDKIEKCYRAGPPIGVGSNKDRTAPRPLIAILENPELARALHRYGNGTRVLAEGKEYWINPDLTRAERRANYEARKLRNERKMGNKETQHSGNFGDTDFPAISVITQAEEERNLARSAPGTLIAID